MKDLGLPTMFINHYDDLEDEVRMDCSCVAAYVTSGILSLLFVLQEDSGENGKFTSSSHYQRRANRGGYGRRGGRREEGSPNPHNSSKTENSSLTTEGTPAALLYPGL